MRVTVKNFGGFLILVGFPILFLGRVGLCVEIANMSVPTKEQVSMLVEAAWKPGVTSFDGTLYLSVTRPIVPREDLERTVREVYSAIEKKSDRRESAEEFEKSVAREVDRMLKEQQSPAVIKKRVRWNGIQYREDKVSTEGDRTVVDSKTEFNRVIVNAGNPLLKDYTSFEYDLVKKIASIDDKVGSTWKENTLWEAFSIQPVSMLLKSLTMVTLKPEDINKAGGTNFIPKISAKRVSELQEDKNEHFIIRTCPDKYKSYNVDRFVVVARQNPDQPLIVFYCDVKNYLKLYRCEVFDPVSGKLFSSTERDNFDSNGFPKVWITEEYPPATPQVRRAEHVFETVSIDVKLPADLFVYRPPDDFSTVDYRPATPIVLEANERFSGEDKITQPEFTVTKYILMGIGITLVVIALLRMLIKR